MGAISSWLKGGDAQGPAKFKAWLTGDDGRFEGYTYSVSVLVTALMVLAIVLYPITNGIGSIVALVVAILAMIGRRLIENQSRRDVAAMREAQKLYGRGRARNQDYVTFIRLRGEGMLRDNRALRPEAKEQIRALVAWASEREKPGS